MRLLYALLSLFFSLAAFAQPRNDSCTKPELISFTLGGYGTGVFTTDTFNIASASKGGSEYFHPDLVSVGNDKKSIWFKFYLPVKRALRIEVKQPSTKINSKDVGFVTYKANFCYPGYTEATNAYITPLNQFGSSFHPCMEAGWYMIQVGSKSGANGPVFLELTVSYPSQHASVNSSYFDLTDSAYNFGTLSVGRNQKFVEYQTGCHTLQDSTEYYPGIGSAYKNYSQTSWHVLKTDRRIDYLELLLSEAAASPMVYFPTGTKIYANVYEGNVKTSNFKSLKKIDSCLVFDFDNRISTNGFAGKSYLCNLKNNTFYTIQLIFKSDFYKEIRLTLRQRTSDSATLSPQPTLNKMASNSKLGVLKSSAGGFTTLVKDYLSCDARFLNSACGNANPVSGVTVNGVKYTMSTWVSFKLKTPANLRFDFLNSTNNQCAGGMAYRLFYDSIPPNCSAFDTSKLYRQGILDGAFMFCVMPGNYSMQILGIDTADYLCGNSEHLGYNIDIGIKAINSVRFSRFGLSDSSSIDSVNDYKDLQNNQTYLAKIDEFGCEHSILPGANRCDTAHKKAIYRLLKIGDSDKDNISDSGMLSIFNLKTNQGPERIQYALYNKNLKQLAISQNKYFYPDTFSNPGLIANCTNYNVAYNGASSRYYCLTPGDYTLGSFGGDYHLGIKDQPQFIFTKTTTKFGFKSSPENMDTIRSSVDSKVDFFSCINNAEVIDSAMPCGNKKVIYREFYLPVPQLIKITNYAPNSFAFIGSNSVYRGRVSQGISGLKLHKDPDGRRWECFTTISANDCYPLPAGWYTIVSSATGPGYDDKVPFDDVASQNSGSVNGKNRISITIIKQIASKFNRPFKAWSVNDSLNAGKPLSWKPNLGTTVNPRNGYIFNLRTENFTCIPDTPLSMHPIVPCNSNNNHIAYYVFGLQQESYLRVMGLNPNVKAFIFDFDVRKDSSKMATQMPIQGCNTYSRIEMCRIKPGTYTLVLMYSNGASFPLQISPALYIDSVGTSRFDFANKAYDFGQVSGDSVWYSGKKGTSHPTISGRAASSDFFFCTTGSSPTDPTFPCGGYYNPNVYPDKSNNPQYNIDSMGSKYTYLGYHAVRNLWYTFTLKGAGKAKIKIDNLTNGTVWGNNLSYGVYSSDERGNLNFDTLRKYGKVDSTMSTGLSQIEYQPNSGLCNGTSWISVSKDICDSVSERRYYVVVSLNEATLPNLNSQISVNILYDSVPVPLKRYDHYSQANVINGLNQSAPPYTNVTLGSGSLLQGRPGYFSGSTTDTADQTNSCIVYGNKSGTIWYKFKVDSTGTLLLNLRKYLFSTSYSSFLDYTPSNNLYDDNIVLLKEFVSGDSTTNGLRRQYFDYNSVNISKYGRDFATTCISKGWYYIQLSSCGLDCSDYLVPEIVIQFQKGDFCQTPVPLKLANLGSTSGTAIVNCHSIGEGFGENGSNMGCLYGPSGYKSTWFRLDYSDSAKADIEFQLSESTNVLPSDIRFRTFYGGCAALSPGPCNTNSQTVFSLTCMKRGAYFVQVVTPNYALGSINLKVNAKKNLDTTCKPVDTWTPNANYAYTRSCPQNKITFVNYSTTGDSIRYLWKFGFGKSDTSFAPTVNFPVSTVDVDYPIKLIVFNISRSASDSISQNITIPATPIVKLRADTSICKGDTVTFNFASAKYRHFWNNGSTKNVLKVFNTGWVSLTVIQKFGNDSCILTDSAFVKVNKLPNFTLGKDTALCLGDSLVVKGPLNMKNYLWSNGKLKQSIKISGQSVILLVTDSNLCKARDTIRTTFRVYTDTIIMLTKAVCVDLLNLSIKVKPKFSGNFYGSNIDQAGNFSPIKAGSGLHKVNYIFKDSYGCPFKDSILVRVNALPNTKINSAGPFCIDAGIISITSQVAQKGKFYGGSYVDSIGKFNPKLSKTGLHRIYFTATNINLCKNTDSLLVRVNALPDASIISSGPFCIDAGIQKISGKVNVGGLFSGGNYIDKAGNFNPQTAKSGTHKILYSFRDLNGCVGNDSIFIKVNPLPDASIISAGPFCIDAGVKSLKPKINSDGKFYGGTFIDSIGAFNPSLAGSGYHKIFYAFTDSNSCSNYDSTIVRVNLLPDAGINAVGPYCIDAGVKFLKPKSNSGGKFYGGNFIDSGGSFRPALAGSGIHSIYYTITDLNSCTNIDSITIKVNPLPDASINLAGPFCIDAGIQVMLPKVNKGGRFYGGVYIDSAGKFDPKIAGSGFHKIEYIFTDSNGCVRYDSVKIKINTLPDATVLPAGPFCIDVGVQTIKPKTNTGGKFYGGNYIASSGKFDPKLAGSGIHKIVYTYTDINTCTSSDSIMIQVNSLPNASIAALGPYCIDAGIQVIKPKTNTGGKFSGGTFIDSTGNFNPRLAGIGLKKLIYSIKDNNGCKNKDSLFLKVNPLPDASILPAGPFCVDAVAQIIKASKNSGGKFYGGKYIDSFGKFNPKIAGVGLHKVFYRFRDINSCVSIDSITVRINPLPDAGINNAGPYCIDAGLKLMVPRTNIGGIFYAGIYLDSNGKFYPDIAGVGTNKVFYTYTDFNKCTAKDSIVVLVNALPDASINRLGPYCLNSGIVTITPRANPGGTFYGGSYITSAGIFDNGNAGVGKHKVGYSITDGNGCKSKDSIILSVNGLPDARLKPAGPFCDNDGMKVVSAVSSSPLGYFCGTCQPGPGEYVTAAGNFLPDIAQAGTHPVFYKVSDANNCISKDSIKVSVNAKPVFDFNASPLQGCEPLLVNFNAAPGFIKYDWNFGNTQLGSGVSPQTLYASAGNYSVSLKVTDNNSCAVTITKSNLITVNPRPKADFNYSPREINLSITQVQFNNFSKGSSITQFRWDVDDVYETDHTDFSKVFHDSGNIKISLLAVNQWGCRDSISQYVFVIDTFIAFIPNAFSPNGDGINDEFKVGGIGIRYLEMTIYNRWGEKLFERSSNENNFGWDGIYLGEVVPQGAYMFTIRVADHIGRKYLFKGMVTVLK